MRTRFSIAVIAALVAVSSCVSSAPSSSSGKKLEEGFVSPPQEARPRVWWHWMNGNITKEGALKDVEWMNRAGLGGFQAFDAAFATPQVVEKRLVYMDPEWQDVFKAVTEKADSYGMEMAIAGSPGWSESGGPWVEPKQAMKKVVWSELDIQGPFKGTLPSPPTEPGAFQNISMNANAFSPENSKVHYYEDVAVIAMKMPNGYESLSGLSAKITSSSGNFSLSQLTDEDYVTSQVLSFDPRTNDAWIQYEFPEEKTVYGLSLVGANGGGMGMPGMGSRDNTLLQCSNDGKTFSDIASISGNAGGVSAVSFPGVTARYFRLLYKQAAAPSRQMLPDGMDAGDFPGMFNFQRGPQGINVAEFRLFTVPRVNRFLEKAAFANTTDNLNVPGEIVAGIPQSDILDITDKMSSDGTLDWNPGEGVWKVIRFGFSLTGHQNGPASPEATGLEVDKMNADHVRAYFKEYLDMYEKATGGLIGKRGLQYIITDSWEAGAQNWTDNMIDEFKANCGYDLKTWLPAIAGYVVDDSAASDKFLWDYRKTIGDLITANHYNVLTDLLAERGMARYSESHENGRAFTGDGMAVKSRAAVPMSAMWMGGIGVTGTDILESASVSHIYGQEWVAAESLTAGGNAWGYAPEDLKPTADMELASGLNRFVIHESAHQPLDDYKPGLTLGPFGQWFNRHETWAEQAHAWTTYLARSSWMLSRGKNIADILFYYGEDSNATAQYGNALPDIPEGYEFDFVNPDALMNVISVKNGELISPSGASWKVLVLGNNAKIMSLPVAKALKRLVDNGAVVVGSRPTLNPSLSADQTEWENTIQAIWNSPNVHDSDLKAVIGELSLQPDMTYTKPSKDSKFLFQHRLYDGIHIYWVGNRTDNSQDIEASFRVSGLEPEIWNPVTGTMQKASYRQSENGTAVKMHFDSFDALFVVFRKKAAAKEVTLPEESSSQISVEGPWTVAFNGMGAPTSITLESLSDLKDNENPFIRYYSGTMVYSKKVNLPADALNGKVELCLGSVANLAEVKVNGKDLGVVWKKPWKADISSAVKEGDNDIEIRVTNLWVNRLVGDQRGDGGQFTHTTQAFYRAGSPLRSSGLLGPVCVETTK
ncbi:MAG: discoidin domain-containing protein [Bacteroidales bacterium]|nr:discoidin domain-containing protein [Bacteroidales bacterium]